MGLLTTTVYSTLSTWLWTLDRYRSPCRRELREDSCETVMSRFESCWSGELFRQALREGDIDSAWTLLSDAAEQALAVGDRQGGAVSRSQRWQPVYTLNSPPVVSFK